MPKDFGQPGVALRLEGGNELSSGNDMAQDFAVVDFVNAANPNGVPIRSGAPEAFTTVIVAKNGEIA